MNQKSLTKLEFPKIIEMLTDHASSPGGASFCRRIKPMTDLNKIITAQEQTAAAFTRIVKKGIPSFSGCYAVSDSLKRLEIGSALSAPELLRIGKLLQTTARIKSYGRHENADDQADCLDVYFEQLAPLTPLSAEIDRCILGEDEISDDASSKLKQIRRSINGMNDKIHSTMTGLLNGSMRTYLQDAIITMRGDRYCLPVKAEYRSQVNGLIHDQSATGSTLFIEPMAVVKLNNDIRELEIEEAKEIEVILSTLSAQADLHRDEIRYDLENMVELDFIFARAALAMEQNANEPIFNTEGKIHLRKARHPLINAKKVVPIDLSLGEDFDLLIVTGPNTGGKTVSLKTVGLLTLMGQSGLHIPALDRSSLSVFDEVYADIGDEQSIEQSLSTFSAHMTNIVKILNQADSRSLCLFDELCAGTDPTEGAALAISILSKLKLYGARVMATTHYSELKVFALQTSGVENACCEFDVESLSPTYRLLIGIPGKSNAFAISTKLGLGEDIIEDAKGRISENDMNFEDLLADLEKSRITIEKEQLEINQYKEEIQKLKEQLEQKQERLDASRDKILREANEQAYNIIKEAKDLADETIRNFNKYGTAHAPVSEMEKERTKLRDKMNNAQKKMSDQKKNAAPNHKIPKKLRIGDRVKVISMNLNGTVHSLPNAKGDLYVQMGILRSLVNINDLILLEEETSPTSKKYGRTGAGKIKMSKSASVSTEINLIGKTTDEAIALLDKYLDDAYLAHIPSVRIVHGKGTGALRKGVHNYLKRQKHVKSFRLGAFGEGDAGVTIAELR